MSSSPRVRSIATIINAYGRSNRGDSVLLDECIEEIRSTLPDADIRCAIFEGLADARAAHRDVSWSERIGNSVGRGIGGKLRTLGLLLISIASFLPGLRHLARLLPPLQQETLNSIRESDYVISAPGGYIHDTNFAYYVALAHIYLGTLAGARVILAPQSVGPIDASIACRVARWVLARAEVICARESYSYAFLTDQLGLPTSIVKRAGDSAFWNHLVSDDAVAVSKAWRSSGLPDVAGRPVLGLTVVDWTFPKSGDPAAARRTYIQHMAEAIDYLVEVHGVVPIIFNQVTDDLKIAEEIASSARSTVFVDRISHEPDILRAFISRSTVFVGTRFHSCIFAMMAGKPTTAIAYLPKTSYILEDLKLGHRQVSIDDISRQDIIDRVESDLCNLASAQHQIVRAVAEYRDSFCRLRDFLSGRGEAA